MSGQGELTIRGRCVRRLLVSTATLVATLGGGASLAADRPTPSGLPVPRYVSLKFDTVNARAGPGDDHRLLWIYHSRGLPVQVVAETSEWRRICDPEWGLAWVHKRTTDGRRMVMNTAPKPLAIHRSAVRDSRVVAYLNARALAALVRCNQGWCRIRADGVTGWSPATQVWGVDERPQCR
jgi:SH3-like domain-containing protein